MNDCCFHVVTCNLAPDLCSAAPEYRLCDFGDLDEPQLVVVLELLRAIDPLQNDQAAPHLLIEAPAGHFRVQTSAGKLFLHPARRVARAGTELDAPAIARWLAQPPGHSALPAAGVRRTGLKLACTALGVAILVTGYLLYSMLHSASVTRSG